MRILAIRGCNLASLAGEFEIDLARGILGEAGVFAIVGPTGAGKSTLLDAMCAALFDRTPRLGNHSPFKVGRGDDDPATLGAQDVRTLLRRGASAGYAEVDFESGDNRRYRARWAVRRARGATDGNLQDVQVSLAALDGDLRICERLGGTKTETLKAIHQRLGLTFDQFRRSALLAQGDFAAFLRADGKDRSELLERMTGTEIYSRLSVAAHLRATLAEQRLRDQHGAALAIGVLADDARAAVHTELALADVARDAARERLARAEAVARWRIEARRRVRELDHARAAARDADAAIATADPLRVELELRRRAEAIRGVWDDAARLDQQLAVARTKLAEAAELAAGATAKRAEIAARRERYAKLHAPIRTARLAAALVERPAAALPDVEARAVASQDAARWLGDRGALAPEVAAWPDLDARFGQHGALADSIAVADRALVEHTRRSGALERRRVELVADHREAVAAHAKAKSEATAFHQRRGMPLDAAGRAEDDARRHSGELAKLSEIAAHARGAAHARAELDTQLAELENAAAGAGERRVAVATELAGARVLRGERERVLFELRRAAGYEHARAELVAGEPCPLCGALEHPWQLRGAFDELIAEESRKLAETSIFIDAAIAELAELDARDKTRASEMQRLASLRAIAEASIEDTSTKWREQLAALGELVLVADPASPAAERLAAERTDVARAKLEAARAARSQAEAAAKAVAEAQARVQVCAAEVEHHTTALRELAVEVSALAAAIERARGEQAGRVERHAELGRDLAAAIARWSGGEAPGGPRATGGEAPGGPAQRGPEIAARKQIERTALEWQARAAEIACVDAALAAAVAAIDRDAIAAERAVAEARARHDGLADDARSRSLELAVAAESLAEARAAAGFEADALRRLLSDLPGRVDELAEQLTAFGRAADRAHALVREHTRLVADQIAAGPPGGDDPGVDADADRLDELAAAVTVAVAAAARCAATLAADDDARARRAAALAEHAVAERAAEVDRVLGQVIGSHDGKLFRSFAQSLTLDGLLGVANSHLEELAPRYQLERVPKHDLELQVIDRDFGGEVRSVQSLSGGESFLVSLALALGLSSMSAHDVRVRTLLIDEGFGTLDPATLDSALSVLDDLQATGRQVGVISHVPALLDRVKAHVRIAPRGGGRSEVLVPSSHRARGQA
jgi:DNA repair protein SbcC/Rad50